MRMFKHDEPLFIEGFGLVYIYQTLKSTRHSIYIPHFNIAVKNEVVDAVIGFFNNNGFGSMGLEEYLTRMAF